MPSLMLVNPRKRKGRKTKTRKRRRNPIAKANPRRRVRRRGTTRKRYRRNPSARGLKGLIKNTVMPSATAAVGAIGLDIIMGYLPLPDALKTGPMRHVVKGAGAIGLGMLAANVVGRKTAEQFTAGAMTVVMYNAGRELASRFMPNLPLGAYIDDDSMEGLGYYGAGAALDYDEPGSLMAYDSYYDDDMAGMGYMDDDDLEL